MRALIVISLLTILLISITVVSNPAIATPNENANERAKVSIPPNAVEIAPGIFHLGKAVYDGQVVEGIAVFHHKPGHDGGPPGGGGNGGGNGNGDEICFEFLTNQGLKWKGKKEPWLVNAQNGEGLSDGFILSNLQANIQKWEDASSSDILGDGSLTATPLVADFVSPDGLNEVYFGDIDPDEAIGVTIVWFIPNGPPGTRQLIEWDQVYNEADFDWSIGDPVDINTMDFENIATHELGHSVGLGHPQPEDNITCVDETMYWQASEGEINKRTLESGDIEGINQLY